MSYLPTQDSLSSAEGDNRSLENLPKSHAKYFGTQRTQAGIPDKEIPQLPKSHSKYFKESAPAEKVAEKPSSGIGGHLARKVASPAVEFLVNAVTSIPEFAGSIQKMGTQGLNALLSQFGMGISPEELEQVHKLIPQIIGNMPPREKIKEAIKGITGGGLEAKTPFENILQKGAGIAGDIVGFGPGTALGTPLKAGATLAAAGTTATLEEAGVNPWIALGGGIVADLLTRSGARISNFISDLAKKGISKKAGETLGKTILLKPEQVKQGVIESAERLGIPRGEIPLSAQLESPAIQSIESTLRESSLSGKGLANQVENVEKKTLDAFEEIGKSISKREDLLPGAVSEEAVSQLKNVEKHAEDAYNSLYSQASKVLPKEAVSSNKSGTKFFDTLDDTIAKLSGGSGNPNKDAVVTRLSRLSKDWKAKYPNGEIPIRDLIEQKKDFNQIIKYETKGGEDKLMKPLNHFVKNMIEEYGTTNRPFLNRFTQAEKRFGKAAEDFRKNKMVSSLLNGQDPKKILNDMKKPKNYKELKSLFDRTPEGKEAFQDLSKYIFEDIIGTQIKNKEGGISWGKATGMLKKPQNREIVQEIVGPQNFRKLKDIATFSGGIEEGLRKFANTSKTATKGMDVGLIVGSMQKIIRSMMLGSPIGLGKGAAMLYSPLALGRLFSNPKFIEAMVDVTKAAKGTDPNIFWQSAIQAAKLIAQEVGKDPNLD